MKITFLFGTYKAVCELAIANSEALCVSACGQMSFLLMDYPGAHGVKGIKLDF